MNTEYKFKGEPITKKQRRILLVFLCLVLGLVSVVGIFFGTYTPTVTFDVSQTSGDVTSGASGYLYGLAENGVPSTAMCESIDISSVSQKVINGLQHPIGDIDHVAGMLDATDYNVVYLQDIYDTWYYNHDVIMQQRADGTYDWQVFLNEDFLPKVRKSVELLSEKKYADKIVYCLYNECDNGIWFGETRTTDDPYNKFGVWAEYSVAGRDNFNQAWKQTYETVRSLNEFALIGGPGFCDYDHDEILYFLQFCAENDCLPDIMIYHELHDDSVYYWQDHVDDYRAIEASLAIEPLPIIVTEYGRMQDNGYPGKMVQYITKIEDSKVYANNAYWRLANNLNDVCADDNSPNANWWLMRWYADMEGKTLVSKSHDLFKSDFERSVKKRKALDHQGFMGIASVNNACTQMTAVCGGRSGEAKVVFDNIRGTSFENKMLKITVEETVYKGLYGIVSQPVILNEYTVFQKDNSLTVRFTDLDEANAYHITVCVTDETEIYENKNTDVPQRYEFEYGTLLGNAYLYDSYCPTSGGTLGMVGGMENEGDGILLHVNVPVDGTYSLDFVYGNSNDGAFGENGRQNPDDRKHTVAVLSVDDTEQKIYLPNTIKSEYTSCYTAEVNLTKGDHYIAVMHEEGTYVLDSLVVTRRTENESVSVLPDSDRTDADVQSFLVVAPFDGSYMFYTDQQESTFSVDGAAGNTNSRGQALVRLRRGLNYVDFDVQERMDLIVCTSETDVTCTVLTPEMAVLEDAITKRNDKGIEYIDGISSESGSARFTFDVDKSGDYRVTLLYANNDEGGVHDYNVDLIERYVTVEVNGQVQNVFCRNTYSWDTFKTVTFNVRLQDGSNTMILSNDGSIRFNGAETYAPYISDITVCPVVME